MDVTSSQEDYYFTLGVEDTATTEEIRYAYHTLIKRYHPDLNEGNARANERGKRINEAYEVLSDPKKRADYDNWVNGTSASPSPSDVAADFNRDKGQSSEPWYREEAVRRKAQQGSQSASESKEVDVLHQWFREQNLFRRWLTPKDFLLETQGQGNESFTCLRADTNFLDKQVSFHIKEFKMDFWAQSETSVRSTSNNMNYIPKKFIDEQVEIFEDARIVTCGPCRGRGEIPCSNCGEQGSIPCSRTQPCGQCGGDGTIFINCTRCGGRGQTEFRRNCSRCGGSGWITNIDQCSHCNWDGQITYKRTCSACKGSRGRHTRCGNCDRGRVRCNRCGGSGYVQCRRCKGRGSIDCARCDAHGRLVHADFRIHDFKKRTLVRFASEGKHTNNFEQGLRNELVEKNFAGLSGELVQQLEQRPESAEVVRQRRRIESFAVSSYQFQYGKKEVTINQIFGDGGSKKLTTPDGLPISWVRLSIAVIAGITLLIGAIILLGQLAG